LVGLFAAPIPRRARFSRRFVDPFFQAFAGQINNENGLDMLKS
jgi:hypothetical protein